MKYKCVSCTKSEDLAYCKYCVCFAPLEVELLRIGIDARNIFKHAVQISWKIQNEILNTCNDLVLEKIVSRVLLNVFQHLQMKPPIFPQLPNFRFVYVMWMEPK